MGKNFLTILLAGLTLLCACRPKDSAGRPAPAGEERAFSVLVYITGVAAGSPTYEMLAEGAQEFADEHGNVKIKVYEAGFNQAEWEEQLRSMVSGGEYDLVLGSNPSLPELCASVGKSFPAQKFIITDAQYSGSPQISTYLYNQYEQSLFLGYLAGLVTTSGMPFANESKRVGFIAAQEYPLLTRHIVPGFLEGAHRADPDIELDFRVVGNWFDANKAAELASGMINSGVDVFTSIAGGAAQGIVRAIKDRGAYAVSFNTSEYGQAPGFIIGCGIMEQKKLVKEILSDVLAGKIQYGSSRTVGVKEGYLNFIFDDPGYRDYVPAEIQEKFAAFMDDFRSGRIEYTVPPL
ncbi:MAG: BMP family ABC transporter substrate-binding protein [Treponema sp.]|nr:BMP family ABC transporter substrate-binding protein [Treponema sp.]MCL2126648.1 BMP family ABC transporter substrate-binding protein [Treponema sp.]